MVPKYVVLKDQTLVYNVILVVISIYLHTLCTKCQIMYKRILKKGNIEQKGISSAGFTGYKHKDIEKCNNF